MEANCHLNWCLNPLIWVNWATLHCLTGSLNCLRASSASSSKVISWCHMAMLWTGKESRRWPRSASTKTDCIIHTVFVRAVTWPNTTKSESRSSFPRNKARMLRIKTPRTHRMRQRKDLRWEKYAIDSPPADWLCLLVFRIRKICLFYLYLNLILNILLNTFNSFAFLQILL